VNLMFKDCTRVYTTRHALYLYFFPNERFAAEI
jgi:hypothetical protein